MSSSLGDLVRERRRLKGWSQEYLAEKSKLSPRTIQRIEAGKIKRRPQPANLQSLATALGIEVRELQEAPLGGRASDALQTATISLDTDETVPAPAIPSDTTEPVAPARSERKPKRWLARFEAARSRRVVFALVSLLLLAVVALMATSWIRSDKVTISGKVLCVDNERVVGVWVRAVNGGSNFANTYKTNSNGSEAAFTYDLPHAGAYNLHVGCGGSKQDWDTTDITENGSGTIKDHASHLFTCQDVPLVVGRGSCWLKQ